MIIKGDMQQAGGVEFATFRLREGVPKPGLRALSRRGGPVLFLQKFERILHVFLLDYYAQALVFDMAPSQSLVEAYCQQWLHNDVAGEYLTLLDHHSVNMSFWTRIG